MSVLTDQEEDAQLNPRQHPRKTCISRVTIAQEVVLILEPSAYMRRVQIFIPAGVEIFIDEDRPTELNPDGTAPPGLVGRDRNYWLPLFDAESKLNIKFKLHPGQSLVGCVKDGLAHLSLIVEPLGGGE